MDQYGSAPRQPAGSQRDNTQTYVRLAEQEAKRGKRFDSEEAKPEGGLRALLRKLWPFGRR